jgi:hypothetical protein
MNMRHYCKEMATAVLFAVASTVVQAADPGEFDSGMENQAGLVFSPDGKTAYWVAWNGVWGGDPTSPRTIFSSQLEGGRWSEPETVPFSGNYAEDDPFVSPDGQWLYFVSERPADSGDENRDGDIWRYGLTEPHRLERLSVNSEAAEYSPSVTTSGALYFASSRAGGQGQGDLYRAAPSADGFMSPDAVGAAVNSVTGEWNLWVAADESELLFEASSRATNVSVPGDIYYSWQTESGWTAAVPVSSLNSAGSDLLPRLHPDGETLYYATAPIGGHASIRSVSWPALRTSLRADYAPTLLVANRASHEVTFVDLGSGRVTGRIATGEGPHLLSNVDDGRVLATGFGEFPRPHEEPVDKRPPFEQELNSRLTLIDVENRSVLLETRLENCARPHASWIVGKRGFASCQDERQIVEIDLEDGRTVQRFDTQQEGTHVLSFESGSRTLAASNTESGSLTLINIDSGATRIVDLAGGSEGSTEVDGLIWVGNAWAGSVSVVDPFTAGILAHTEPLCNFPIALSPDTRNQVWVACFGSAELIAVDRDSFEVSHRFKLDAQPLNLLIHPSRDLAYASLPRENAVVEIDLYSGKEVRRIRVGIEPDGLRWGL